MVNHQMTLKSKGKNNNKTTTNKHALEIIVLKLNNIFCWDSTLLLTSEFISRRCLLEAGVHWPLCCYTGMPCRRHRTWHTTPSQYTDTGQMYHFAFHWFVTHWNPQLPALIRWVWLNPEILFPTLHSRSIHSTKSLTHPGPVMCESSTLPQRYCDSFMYLNLIMMVNSYFRANRTH